MTRQQQRTVRLIWQTLLDAGGGFLFGVALALASFTSIIERFA